MSSREVQTIAKDKTLTDQVRESPVDQYEVRIRRIVCIVLVVILIAIVVF